MELRLIGTPQQNESGYKYLKKIKKKTPLQPPHPHPE
jgi:hypothetical protein